MRSKNWRLIYTGGALALAAVAFFFYMWGIAPRSNDPRALMQIVGQVSGVAGGIGIAMAAFGWIGKKPG